MLAPKGSRIRRGAVLSDSHGIVQNGVLEAIRDADLIVHAGDVGSSLVLDELAKIAPVVAVAGNNDNRSKWRRCEHARLEELPEVQEIGLPGGLLAVIHGHQWPKLSSRHAKARQKFPYARCVVYGHSHRLVVDRDEEPWVVNPGACGCSRTYGGANWLGLTACLGKWALSKSRFD